MPAERVNSYLMQYGVSHETHTHPVAYSTSEVAEARHLSGREMAKAVLLKSEDGLAMAVVPGDRMVDLEKAATALGIERCRSGGGKRLSESFPDCESGPSPPFGALYEVPTLVDLSLTSPKITVAAGTHIETITMGSTTIWS